MCVSSSSLNAVLIASDHLTAYFAAQALFRLFRRGLLALREQPFEGFWGCGVEGPPQISAG